MIKEKLLKDTGEVSQPVEGEVSSPEGEHAAPSVHGEPSESSGHGHPAAAGHSGH